MKHRLTFLLLAAAGPASAAVVDVPPPWVRWDPPTNQFNQYAIYAYWDFGTNATDPAPDNLTTIVANPIHCPACPNEVSLPVSGLPGDPTWAAGVWSFTQVGQIDGSLANVIDNFPRKEVQVAITWFGALVDDAPEFKISSATDSSIGIIPVDGGSIDNYNSGGIHTLVDPQNNQWVSVYNSRIMPNPDSENFQITMKPGTAIDGFVMDTISIPETGNAVLIGLLCSSGLFLRGRRS